MQASGSADGELGAPPSLAVLDEAAYVLARRVLAVADLTRWEARAVAEFHAELDALAEGLWRWGDAAGALRERMSSPTPWSWPGP